LSEAVAKANCVEEVIPKFVIEAYDLLRQSIVTVEKDDVEMDDDVPAQNGEDHEMGDDRDRENDSPMRDDGDQAQQQERAKTKITYDKFSKILNLIVRRIREDEVNQGEGVEQEDLILWYLEQIEGELNTHEDMARERDLAKKVLKRMVKDHVLLRIASDLMDAEGSTQQTAEDKVLYVMHPNVAYEEM
jgi:DNA replication licensing factor MCM6